MHKSKPKTPHFTGVRLRIIPWLGRRDLFQTFSDEILTDEQQIRDIHEIRQLIDESGDGSDEETATC